MSERYEYKPGSGAIFQHSMKSSERSPDWGGEIRLDQDYKAGDTIRLSLWQKSPTRMSIGIKHPRPPSEPR